MKKFLTMLLAVLFCTTAMCITDVFAYSNTSVNTTKSNNTSNKSNQIVKSAVSNSTSDAYSEEEVYLTAQLVWHEAHNQPYNGKVAIAEVVLNRVKSGLFPNTVADVINQSGQFANSRRLSNVNPTDVELRIAYNVLNGNLRTLNDSDVLYFRNPKITSGVSAKVDKNWGDLDYATYIGDHAFYAQDVNSNVASNDNVKAVEEKTTASFLDKLPTSISLSNFFNKAKKASAKDIDSEVKVEDAIENTSENTVENANDISVDNSYDLGTQKVTTNNVVGLEAIVVDNTVADNTEVDKIEADNDGVLNETQINTMILMSLSNQNVVTEENENVDLVLDDSTNEQSDETVDNDETDTIDESETSYESEVILTAANEIADDNNSSIDDELEELENEEIDENDPVARAQRQARIDEKLRLKQMAKLEAENTKANEAAVKFAKQNESDAVERVNTFLKLGEASTN